MAAAQGVRLDDESVKDDEGARETDQEKRDILLPTATAWCNVRNIRYEIPQTLAERVPFGLFDSGNHSCHPQ